MEKEKYKITCLDDAARSVSERMMDEFEDLNIIEVNEESDYLVVEASATLRDRLAEVAGVTSIKKNSLNWF